MNYNVGDKVRVISYVEDDTEYDLVINKVGTVTENDSTSFVEVDLGLDSGHFLFFEDELEIVK